MDSNQFQRLTLEPYAFIWEKNITDIFERESYRQTLWKRFEIDKSNKQLSFLRYWSHFEQRSLEI